MMECKTKCKVTNIFRNVQEKSAISENISSILPDTFRNVVLFMWISEKITHFLPDTFRNVVCFV